MRMDASVYDCPERTSVAISEAEAGEQVTYVIAEPCIGAKDNSCIEVCPVDCIHPTPDEADYEQAPQLYIDPEECIDCDACTVACPVDAPVPAQRLPEQWRRFAQINADYYA